MDLLSELAAQLRVVYAVLMSHERETSKVDIFSYSLQTLVLVWCGGFHKSIKGT